MRGLFAHLLQNPFISATAAAALVHSTWTLAVMFAGEPPVVTMSWSWVTVSELFTFAVYWGSAAAIAFALDVGQVVTSAEIRGMNVRGLSWWKQTKQVAPKLLTFTVFAGATWYLQFLYMAHHMPNLILADGIRDEWATTVTLMRDFAVFFIPALLPLSTLLYTFSSSTSHSHNVTEQTASVMSVNVENPAGETPLITEQTAQDDEHVDQEQPHEHHVAVCNACGWEGSRTYATKTSAKRALAAHMRTCPSLHPEQYPNGNHQHKDVQ